MLFLSQEFALEGGCFLLPFLGKIKSDYFPSNYFYFFTAL